MEIKDCLLILFGALVGAFSFVIKDLYLWIKNCRKEKSDFLQVVNAYKPVIKRLKVCIEEAPGRVLELRSGNKLFLCSFGGKEANPIIIHENFDAGSFLADLYCCKFIYYMDLDTSLITSGGQVARVGNKTVKYVLTADFLNKVKKQ